MGPPPFWSQLDNTIRIGAMDSENPNPSGTAPGPPPSSVSIVSRRPLRRTDEPKEKARRGSAGPVKSLAGLL